MKGHTVGFNRARDFRPSYNNVNANPSPIARSSLFLTCHILINSSLHPWHDPWHCPHLPLPTPLLHSFTILCCMNVSVYQTSLTKGEIEGETDTFILAIFGSRKRHFQNNPNDSVRLLLIPPPSSRAHSSPSVTFPSRNLYSADMAAICHFDKQRCENELCIDALQQSHHSYSPPIRQVMTCL